MKNYIICFYFLQHCLYHTLEEDLADLLGKMQFEDVEVDKTLYEDWKDVIDCGKMTDDEIAEAIADKLELSCPGLSRTIRYIRTCGKADYFALEARQNAEEYLGED